jgi:hypothetical protein
MEALRTFASRTHLKPHAWRVPRYPARNDLPTEAFFLPKQSRLADCCNGAVDQFTAPFTFNVSHSLRRETLRSKLRLSALSWDLAAHHQKALTMLTFVRKDDAKKQEVSLVSGQPMSAHDMTVFMR